MAQIPNPKGIKPVVKPVVKPAGNPADRNFFSGSAVPVAPKVAPTVNVVRPSLPVVAPPTDERRLMGLRPATAPPPAQFAFENIPRPENKGFAAAATTPPNNFWADPTGYGQPLYDNFLSKILPSSERLDNSGFSYLNLLDPRNKFKLSMIPGIIGSAVPGGAAFNLVGEAIKESGYADTISQYGPLAALGVTAAKMFGNRNDPIAMARNLMPLFKSVVTNEVVGGLNDATGLNWSPAVPAIYPNANLGFVNPQYTPPAGATTQYGRGGPVPALVSELPSTANANQALQDRTALGHNVFLPALREAEAAYQRAALNYEDIIKKEAPNLALYGASHLQTPSIAEARRIMWEMWQKLEFSKLDLQSPDRTPEAIDYDDNIQRQKSPYTKSETREQQLFTRQQKADYDMLLEEYYSKHGLTKDITNAPDSLQEERERIWPSSIEDHANIKNLVDKSLESIIPAIESRDRFKNLFGIQNFGAGITDPSRLEGAPSSKGFQSQLDYFINKYEHSQKEMQSVANFLKTSDRAEESGDYPSSQNYQNVSDRILSILNELKSRPKIEGYNIKTPSTGEHLKVMNSLANARQQEIERIDNLIKFQPLITDTEKNTLVEERKRLTLIRPDMYVQENDMPSNLDTNFYSRINRSIENQPLTRPMTGKEWMSYLNNSSQQLNQGELKQTGIANYLVPNQTYTKEEVLKFAQDNQLKIASTVFFAKGKGYADDYEWNAIDKIKGPTDMIDTGDGSVKQRLSVNSYMPGGENYRRDVQVIIVGEQGVQVLDPAKPRTEGHRPYNTVNNPIGRLEVEGIKVNGDDSLWLHEIQGPKQREAKNMPNFLKFDNQGIPILLKRLLMFAHKNGYKSLQWTNGKTQMQRRHGGPGLGKIYDVQLVEEMNKIIKKTGIKMDLRARPDLPAEGLHPWLDLSSPAMQKFLSEGMPVSKIFPKKGEEQRSIT